MRAISMFGIWPRANLSCAAHSKARAIPDRKSTRLNSSHSQISYAVFCLKKKKSHSDVLIYDHEDWAQAQIQSELVVRHVWRGYVETVRSHVKDFRQATH